MFAKILTIVLRRFKRSIHKVLAIFQLEVVKENDKIKLRRRFYIGADYLDDISKIIGSAKNVHVCIDGGGHHGETALLLADTFPEAKIYSFEPAKDNFNKIKNISSCERIIPINAALGNVFSTQLFNVNSDSLTGSLLEATQECEKYVHDSGSMRPISTEMVSVEALSDWAEKNAIKSIDILKLDLQGYELRALKGAEALLRSKRVLFIYVEVNFVPAYVGQASLNELYEYCYNFGYRLVGLYPNEFNAHKFHYRCGGDILFVLENLNEFNKDDQVAV